MSLLTADAEKQCKVVLCCAGIEQRAVHAFKQQGAFVGKAFAPVYRECATIKAAQNASQRSRATLAKRTLRGARTDDHAPGVSQA